jgi:transposase
MNLATVQGKETWTMARKKYLVTLNPEEQQQLEDLTRKGKAKAREFKRAMILLKANEGLSDAQIMAALNVSRPCVERIRQRYVTGGLDKALHEDPRPGQKRKLDGRGEAHLIAITCTPVPEGYEHWELRLLADKLVEQGIVESISYETVRQVLKKTNSNPGKSKCGVSLKPVRSM